MTIKSWKGVCYVQMGNKKERSTLSRSYQYRDDIHNTMMITLIVKMLVDGKCIAENNKCYVHGYIAL